MNRRQWRKGWILFLLGGLSVVAGPAVRRVQGQSVQGSIVGDIKDPSGAFVVGVTVTATNQRTTFVRTAVSNEAGHYEFPNLDPSEYTVKAEMSGFKSYVNQNVVLTAREALRVDIKLELGEVSEVINVEAQAAVIRTEEASVKSSLDYALLDKPVQAGLFGGGFTAYAMAERLPGVQRTEAYGAHDGAPTSISGARASQSGITVVDGVRATSFGTVPYNAVEEFKVERYNTAAEYATSGSWEQTLRQGTGEYHGELMGHLGNSGFRSRNVFYPNLKPFLPTYDIAVAAGGPFVFPKLHPRKDKTFFFVSYERRKAYDNTAPGLGNVPTTAMRNGDLRGLGVTVVDPVTGQPFPDNQIPANRISQQAKNVLNLLPTPNTGDPTQPFRNVVYNSASNSSLYLLNFRVDHNLTSRQTVSFSYNTKLSDSVSDVFPVGLYQGATINNTYEPRLAWTFTISPTMVNEFRVGASRNYVPQETVPQKVNGGLEYNKLLGFTGLENAPAGKSIPYMEVPPVFNLSGYNHSRTVRNYFTFIDNFTWVKGKHTIKMGGAYYPYQWNELRVPKDSYGSIVFTGKWTNYAYADFLLGVPQETRVSFPPPEIAVRIKEYNFYIQDKWNITPRLTLHYGLRQEYWTVPLDAHDHQYNVDLRNPQALRWVVPSEAAKRDVHPLWPVNKPIVTAAEAGFPTALRANDAVNLAPRLAIAYRFDDKTAVRLGYGHYHDRSTTQSAAWTVGGPFSNSTSYINELDPVTKQFRYQFPRIVPVGSQETRVQAPNSGYDTPIEAFNSKRPYFDQWSMTIDREIEKNTRISVAYVGSKASQLPYVTELNYPTASTTPFDPSRKPYPQVGNIWFSGKGGNQTSHQLEILAFRRYAGGLSFEGGWTWNRILNDTYDSSEDFALAPVNTPGSSSSFINFSAPFRRKGPQEGIAPHTFKMNAVWDLPFGRGRQFLANAPAVVNGLLGGWSTSHFIDIRSGIFLTPWTVSDSGNTGIAIQLPDRVCDGRVKVSDPVNQSIADAKCFPTPPAGIGRWGNSGRGVLRGSTNSLYSLGMFKSFSITERVKFRFGAYASNIFNLKSYSYYSTYAPDPNFGKPTFGLAAQNYSIKQWEFEGKLSF